MIMSQEHLKKIHKAMRTGPHSVLESKLFDLTKLNYEPLLEAHYSPGQRQFGTAVKSRSQNFRYQSTNKVDIGAIVVFRIC